MSGTADDPARPLFPVSPAAPAQPSVSRRRATGRTRDAVELALAVLAVATSSLALWSFYGSPLWLPPVLGGLLLGTALGVAAARRRWPGWLVAPTALLALATYQLYAAHWESTSLGVPTLEALRATLDGLVSGWARMLTVALPADVRGDVLALPVTLAFLAGLASALVVLRTAWRAVLALPSVLVLLAGLGYTATRPGPGLTVTAGTLAVVLVLLLVRATRRSTGPPLGRAAGGGAGAGQALVVGDAPARRRHSPLGRVVIGLPGVAAVVVLAAAAATLLPLADGDARADPRELYPEEVELRPALSPLVEVQPQALGDDTELYRVRVTRLTGDSAEPDRVRVAALDTFDGALWTASGSFLRAGTRLPTEQRLAAPVSTVRLDVEVVGPTGAFLPVVGQPTRLTGVAAAVEGSAGTLVALDPPGSGTRYTLEAGLPAGDDVQTVGVAPDAERYTELPDPPEWVAEQAQLVVEQAGADTAWGELAALQAYYRERPYASQAPPGHSYAAVFRTLLGTEDDRAGHVEQYASGFTVLARSLGYPARVAVGYRLLEENLEGDTYAVGTAEAHAWPEVLLEGYGWVVFEPSNPENDTLLPPPRAPDAAPGQDDVAEVVPPAEADPDAREGAEEATGLTVGRVVEWGLYVLAALAALALAVVLGTLAGKPLRRARRRSRGDPARRVGAAWSETRDRLREVGYDAPESATPAEVAGRASAGPAELAQDAVTELAVIATAATFAPAPPEEPAAVRAWELEAEARRAIGRGLPLHRRILAAVDPRPLLPRTGVPRVRGAGPPTARHGPGSDSSGSAAEQASARAAGQ